jgi:Fe(3+) dicitrate transport protein
VKTRIAFASVGFAAAFFALLDAHPSRAQTGTIEGSVIDAASHVPLADANLTVVGTQTGGSSAINGRYSILGVPAGEYIVGASMLGYRDAQLTVTVREGQVARLDFLLNSHWLEIPEIVVERVMLTGGLKGIESLPGSAHFISPMELERFDYGDVGRVLRRIPGVNIQEEDGYGLRPNIGLRGSGSERSAKITVMEDGVLIAPAPYAAPAAYYFPTVGRMQAIEVRKGSSQIKYGPYTTGGALNLISTQIPSQLSGRFDLLAGGDDSHVVRANIGTSFKHAGFLLETYQSGTDGFKQIDGGGTSGFEKRDFLGKIRLATDSNARVYQEVTVKLGRATESSDETYLGLTDADFAATPSRRYAASQADRMSTEQSQVVARHVIRASAAIDVTTTLYRTDFSRNWYKLDAVRSVDGVAAVRIGEVLTNPSDYIDEIDILQGSTSENEDALVVKANNRSYYARGVQSVVGVGLATRRTRHEFELGIRVHEDQIDRFQWNDQYRMADGIMVRTVEGIPGSESNRVERARATSGFLQYRLVYGRLTFVPGIRYEHVSLRRLDYGRDDLMRTGIDLSDRANAVDSWIPGVGLDVDIAAGLHAFAGVHRGFAPPDSRDGTLPESSLNYELGGRLLNGMLQAEAVLFYTDYSNLLGADLAASGGDGTTNQFNGGAVDVHGLELSAAYDLGMLSRRGYSFPIRANYTFTSAQFKNSFESDFEPWATVRAGDDLPYVPRHQFGASFGLETRRFSFDLSGEYSGRMRTNAAQGDYVDGQSTDAHLTMDFAASYRVSRRVRLVGRVLNLTDVEYVAARRPAGIRPGLPRRLAIGIKTIL